MSNTMAWPPTRNLSAGIGLKVFVIALIALAVFVFVSGSKRSGEQSPATGQQAPAAAAQPAETQPAQLQPAEGQLVQAEPAQEAESSTRIANPGHETLWTGTIAGETDFSLRLSEDTATGVVFGELTYTITGIPILVVGQRFNDEPGKYYIQEFNSMGQTTGYLWLTDVVDGNVGTATWGTMSATLTRTGEVAVTPGPATIGGVYRYDLGDGDGAHTGTLSVGAASDGSINVMIGTVGSAPAYNLAIIDGLSLPLKGNRAVWTSPIDDPRCSFEINFYPGFARVDQIDSFDECRADSGFGNNATVVGTYIVTSS